MLLSRLLEPAEQFRKIYPGRFTRALRFARRALGGMDFGGRLR